MDKQARDMEQFSADLNTLVFDELSLSQKAALSDSLFRRYLWLADNMVTPTALFLFGALMGSLTTLLVVIATLKL